MIGRLNTLDIWHRGTQNLTHFGGRILAILTLTFVLVGANPSSSARAAQASDGFIFVMTAVPSAEYVCTGETMKFRVSISRQLSSKPGDTKPEFDMISGVKVDATVADTSIGNIAQDFRYRRSQNPSIDYGAPQVYYPDIATFTFTAGKNPGKTSIKFWSDFSRFWVAEGLPEEYIRNLKNTVHVEPPSPVQVDVRKCFYKVMLIAQKTMNGLVSWNGTGYETPLNMDSSTHFSGTTEFFITEHWLFDPDDVGCSITSAVAPTSVLYEAVLSEGTLDLTFTIQKATINREGSGSKNCGFSFPAEFASYTDTVKLPSQGGVISLPGPFWFGLIIVTRGSYG